MPRALSKRRDEIDMESHDMDRRRRPLNSGFCPHVHDSSHLLLSLVDHAASPTIPNVCCIGTRRRMSCAVRVFVSMHSSLLMMTMSRRAALIVIQRITTSTWLLPINLGDIDSGEEGTDIL